MKKEMNNNQQNKIGNYKSPLFSYPSADKLAGKDFLNILFLSDFFSIFLPTL
jgi:hypothetical protein